MCRTLTAVLLLFLAFPCLSRADDLGTANGKGVLDKVGPNGDDDRQGVPFAPKYSLAFVDKQSMTWVVLTEVKPPIEEWLAAADHQEARRAWCEKEKTPFVSVKLDAAGAPDILISCPANGGGSMDMVSTINGLASVVLNFSKRDTQRVTGTLKNGEGWCPTSDGKDAYCTPKGDYQFDAPLLRMK